MGNEPKQIGEHVSWAVIPTAENMGILPEMSDRDVLIMLMREVLALKAYVADLDQKSRDMFKPEQMEKMMSGMFGNMLGM